MEQEELIEVLLQLDFEDLNNLVSEVYEKKINSTAEEVTYQLEAEWFRSFSHRDLGLIILHTLT